MKTNNLFEALKKYFEHTSIKQILEDWEKSEKYDECGLSVEDFIHYSNKQYEVQSKNPGQTH